MDNLRNRYIGGYPELIVTMSNEFDEFKKLTVEEAQHLQYEHRNEFRSYNAKNNKFNKLTNRNFDNKVLHYKLAKMFLILLDRNE